MTAAEQPPEVPASAVVRPLAGMVVKPEWAKRVVSPLVDSLSAQRRGDLLAANPDSYLHVTRSRADFATTATPDEIGSADAAALQRLLKLGAYDDLPPAMYVYRIREHGKEHTGVVADVDWNAFVDRRVRGHESVHADRVDALARHYAAVPARSEPVMLLHSAGGVIRTVVDAACTGQPLLRFGDPDSLQQTVWRVGPDGSAAVAAAVEQGPMYVADGHHRVAAGLRDWQRRGRPPEAGAVCALYSPDGLDLLAFHRRVPGPIDSPALLSGIDEEFDTRPIAGPREGQGCFSVYVAGRWYDASYQHARLDGVAGLDASVLQDQVLGPLLGIKDADPRLEPVAERASVAEATARCDADGGALFVLQAPPVEDLMAIADRGEQMLPKTTYFAPKPQAGIFLRLT